ncbi:MAG: amidohydrolase family protein [Flavobacteriales bacterium]|nr:amidohydrolase family protein [Flavobacteriales bacterium]
MNSRFPRSLFMGYQLLIAGCILSSCNFIGNEVDMIVHNAKIYSVNESWDVYEAMVIDDGKIIHMGRSADVLHDYASKNVIDAKGKFVYPGFIDAHCHFLGYGRTLQEVNLIGTKSFDEVIERVVEHRKKFPDKKWIIGRGWDQNDWQPSSFNKEKSSQQPAVLDMNHFTIPFPDNEKLNELFPDVPVALKRIDGHVLLVNQKALDLAGITTETKVEGGYVQVVLGKLTGILVDNATKFVEDIIPEYTVEEDTEALLDAQKNCFEVGLTTVDDAGLLKKEIDLIKQLQQEDKLRMRIYAMLSDEDENFDYYLKNGIDTSDFLSVRAFKFYADGALGSRGACLLSPYEDIIHKKEYGFLLDSIAYFRMRAEQLYDAGFQMCTHAIGDSANRMMLDVYSAVLGGMNDKRWRIEHAQVVHKNDVAMFGASGIIPSIQPTHATSDMPWAWQRLGRNRVKRAYAYSELKDQLGMVALGTDFPVEGISPINTFYAAVVRKNIYGIPEEGFQTENALSRQDALSGITIWAALSNFEEHKKGSLEVGKFADFVMLDKDLMTVSAEEMLSTKVVMTVVGGEVVFRQP